MPSYRAKKTLFAYMRWHLIVIGTGHGKIGRSKEEYEL